MYKLLMLVTLLPSLALANAAEDLVAEDGTRPNVCPPLFEQ